MDKVMVFSVALNIILILGCLLTVYISNKKNIKITKEKNLLSNIINISFENEMLDCAMDDIIYKITQIYSVKYVSIFQMDSIKDELTLISSNVPDKYIDSVVQYSKEIKEKKLSNYDAYIEKTLKRNTYLTYESAEKRFIKYLYYIPLHMNNKCIGALMIEDVNSKCLVNIKKEFFSLVINNIVFTIRNLFFTQQIKKSADIDGLTRVYNKKFMYEHLSLQMEKSRSIRSDFCLVIFDIDYFKRFNDTYGHQHGDTVLKKVANYAKSKLKENEYIYRFGGEEFIIYLPNITIQLAYERMDEFRDTLSDHEIRLKDSNELTPVTISLGIAKYPEDALELDDLIKKADTALYQAKRNGRNRVKVYIDNK